MTRTEQAAQLTQYQGDFHDLSRWLDDGGFPADDHNPPWLARPRPEESRPMHDPPTRGCPHTPGPWLARMEDHTIFVGTGTQNVAEVIPDTMDEAELRANARLIAAAPDLLAALQTLLADMEAEYRDRNGDADHDGMDKARAAVAGATQE
jgi:hypothetical protein